MIGTKKELIFYAVAGSLIGGLASVMGASMTVVLLLSLLIPPVLLIIYRIIR